MNASHLPPVLPRDLLSVYDLMFMFGVKTYVTIWNWKQNRDLPFHEVPGSTKSVKSVPLRYSLKEIRRWAKEVDLEIVNEPVFVDGKVSWKDNAAFERFKKSEAKL